jgi:lipoic acid synthetase
MKPEWLRVRLPGAGEWPRVRSVLNRYGLHTVCQEALCPNLGACWGDGTATFLILGNLCTRSCRFCAVTTGKPDGTWDRSEPERVALAASELGLRYLVVTSVDRDDLDDGGASGFAATIQAVARISPQIFVEVLIPDFSGSNDALSIVVKANPAVLGHNVETVRRLTPLVRDRRSSYDRSLGVLSKSKELSSTLITKSGLMLGLGETDEEIVKTMVDLREAGCQIVTLGQYLQPSVDNLPVARYVEPAEFDRYRTIGLEMGFCEVVAGPLVRSSYRAHQAYEKARQRLYTD